MTERELIKRIKKKDDQAFNELLNNYINLIYKVIRSYSLGYCDFNISEDELYQEGCIALYEACVSYSKVKNCKFSTFAYVIIRRKIGKAMTRHSEIYKHEGVSYDKYSNADRAKIFENKYVYDNPIEYSNRYYLKKEANYTISKLKKIDQKIVKLRLQNYSYAQISKMLKIPKKKIDNRLQYLKKKNFYKD